MPIVYKIDVLQALKQAGYNTNKIRQEKLLSESTLQQLRHGAMVSMKSLDGICNLLDCQPGDILARVDGETEKKNDAE